MNKTSFTYSLLLLHPFLSYVSSVLFSTLPPASLNTLATKPAHGVAKEMVTSFSTAAICVERVPVRRARGRMILKINTWIAVSIHTNSDGKTEAERTGRGEKKKKRERPDRPLLMFQLLHSSSNLCR